MGRRGSRKKNFKDVHGILLLDKPAGITSNQALQKVRHLFQANKAGHTGNLDPMATGLLPCCLGDATKVADLMINADKAYQTTAVLGIKMNTADVTGEVTSQQSIPELTAQKVQAACDELTAEIEQIPPMYSALHHQGRRLYELAREGVEVERKARKINIYGFDCEQININKKPPTVTFTVRCSKGTYIRTLIEDWAKKLGTLAHINALHRIQSGLFEANQMISLSALEAADDLNTFLLPPEAALIEHPSIHLDEQQAQDLIHGKQTAIETPDGLHRLYDEGGYFMGMGHVYNAHLRVHKLFMKSYQQSLGKKL